MIRLIVFALLCFLGYTVFTMVLRSLPGRGKGPEGPKAPRGEEMVQDPQCGTYVPRSEAVKKVSDGQTHYFCSAKCRDAYGHRK